MSDFTYNFLMCGMVVLSIIMVIRYLIFVITKPFIEHGSKPTNNIGHDKRYYTTTYWIKGKAYHRVWDSKLDNYCSDVYDSERTANIVRDELRKKLN